MKDINFKQLSKHDQAKLKNILSQLNKITLELSLIEDTEVVFETYETISDACLFLDNYINPVDEFISEEDKEF